MEIKGIFRKATLLLGLLTLFFGVPAQAHCDSYDGPVIQDAYRALEQEDIRFIMKWIAKDQEEPLEKLFHKTVNLKGGDPEIYGIVETHFLETLVRLHRETEGAPYTGLKPAGSATPIVQMADRSLAELEVTPLLSNLERHIRAVIVEKYEKVAALHRVKDDSIAQGRAYVAAYVDYTHTLEGLEAVLAHGGHH